MNPIYVCPEHTKELWYNDERRHTKELWYNDERRQTKDYKKTIDEKTHFDVGQSVRMTR